MECSYFGMCGSCRLYEDGYEGQLAYKKRRFIETFGVEPTIFSSPHTHFRARAEFRIIEAGYAMHSIDGKGYVRIEACPIVLQPIYDTMPKLLDLIKNNQILLQKLFRIDFLSGLSGEILASLVYHKAIDQNWYEAAKELASSLDIQLVGRSRGVKKTIGRDYIVEKLPINDREFTYHHYEGSFTQPNPYVNIEMIEWAIEQTKDIGGDLLELYCGAGNFTLPLSQNFQRVLATEVSKTSIKAAKKNCEMNDIHNIHFVRLSSEEVAQAMKGERSFRRLAGIDLASFDFRVVFVDPPRCGLDSATRKLLTNFENIVYISCNPQTLKRDLEELQKTHRPLSYALFDQFPYTPHMESGVFLVRR